MRLLCLAPDGVYLASDITAPAGGLLHHPFTLTPAETDALCSLLHFPSSYLAWLLASIAPCGVRTFLSPVNAEPRSPV